jgi:CDP-diacylglycerol---glycerol-3-phosphate 3-phosphatidyltransferase
MARTESISIATWVTLSRLLGVPVLLVGLQDNPPFSPWITLGIFLLVALTDWLDGYLARRLNQVTDLGKILDPLVDKLLVTAPLLSFVAQGLVPDWAVFLIIARELTVAGWRVNQTQISGANIWGKLKTVTQIVAIALLIVPPLPQAGWVHGAGLGCFWLALALTLISGAIYLVPAPASD